MRNFWTLLLCCALLPIAASAQNTSVVLRIIWRKYLNDKWRKVAPQRLGSHGH
jgi:hypothetical protein